MPTLDDLKRTVAPDCQCANCDGVRKLIRVAEAAKEISLWRQWPEVSGAFSYAAMHGFQCSLEKSEEAEKIWQLFDNALKELEG